MSVACGVHTGSFSTDELITRVQKTRLPEVVSRRALILPQLGAQAVSAEEVRRRAGFEIIRGPERSGELSSFIARGARGTSEITAVRFACGTGCPSASPNWRGPCAFPGIRVRRPR